MDFSSQLANLQKTANAAASSREQDGRGGGPDRRRPQFSPDRRRHAPFDSRRGRNHRRGGGGPRNNLMDALSCLPPYRPPSHSTSRDDKNPIPHVALLVISIDDLPYEEIWKEWASPENEKKAAIHVSILCHAKHPNSVKSSWLRQRLLVHPPVVGRGHEYEPPCYSTRCPEWGSIEITRAMIDLVKEGLEIGYCRESDPRFSKDRYSVQQRAEKVTPVDKFIFCSETCLPVGTLEEIKTSLFGTTDTTNVESDTKQAPGNASTWDVSWVHARNTPNNGYSRQLQFDKVSKEVPGSCIWKADQWMVLSRRHAAAIMDIDRYLPRDAPLWRCFVRCKASDEMYFPTALALLGLLNNGESAPFKDQINNRRITFADWSESAKNPASYTKGVKDLKAVANVAVFHGCLFARKFSPYETIPGVQRKDDGVASATGMITAEEWKSVIEEILAE